MSQFSTAAADDIAPSFLETIYGVNVIGAIRKLFSYWFSLKWEENGVFWRLLTFFSPSFLSASLPSSFYCHTVNKNWFQKREFLRRYIFKQRFYWEARALSKSATLSILIIIGKVFSLFTPQK